MKLKSLYVVLAEVCQSSVFFFFVKKILWSDMHLLVVAPLGFETLKKWKKYGK